MTVSNIRSRISGILKAITTQVYEREHIVALSLLGALSGENVFLLGKPGVGKSLVSRRLKYAFSGARSFEYLMSRFSTPDDVFGPVSISQLKDHDSYERKTEGFLPDAEVVFLDEIWKAGPAIQNALLTVLNERVFLNGQKEMKLPTKLVISASNELPAEGEGLEALWDRFLIRDIVEPIRSDLNFTKLLQGESSLSVDFEDGLTEDEYQAILSGRDTITIPAPLVKVIVSLRNDLATGEDDGNIYISDRRWAKVAKIMRTSALLNGRKSVDISDFLLMEHLLWNHPDERPYINDLVEKAIVGFMPQVMVEISGRKPKKKEDKLKYYSPDGVHYEVKAGEYTFKIRIKDYEAIKEPTYGSIDVNDVIIPSPEGGEVSLSKTKEGTLSINSVNYPLTPIGRMEESEGLKSRVDETVGQQKAMITILVSDNLFCKPIEEYPVLYNAIKGM